ncbi:hypothetical protein CWC22_014495 [Pseudoalteromonas rubra]|uniref:DUF3021 domain-containing protein n=1 Tax=Pseudoalteromonas rubra TaxID=43658 RepID=A0A5S3UPJ7_9GAMM|nr:hypothetical protein [Pseudoalteromonas rubra]QPB84136.1 hypothetical protein CWC22_014495 [Pseudoalteromonas rubra]
MKKWKILFGFSAFITALEFIGLPFKEHIDFNTFVSLILYCSILIPMYGYAYGVAIGSKAIAILIFVLTILVPGSLVVLWGVAFTINHFSLIQLVFSLGTFGLLLFISYPVFMYAFRSDKLWAKERQQMTDKKL